MLIAPRQWPTTEQELPWPEPCSGQIPDKASRGSMPTPFMASSHLCFHIYLNDYLNNVDEPNEGGDEVCLPVCLQHPAQGTACNWYSVYAFVEWVNKWNSDLAHPHCLIPLRWVVLIHTLPADLHSIQSKNPSVISSFCSLWENDKPEQKLRLGKRGQILLSHSQQRFSQHVIGFSPFGKLAIFYCLSGRDAMERIDQELGRGPYWVSGYDIIWQLVRPSSGSPCQVMFESVTSSPRAGTPFWVRNWQPVPRGCLPTPSQGFAGQNARESWSLQGKQPAV